MSGELFQWQQLVTLESSKVESIVLSSEWITPSRNAVDGTDLDHLHLFVALKGGKLFQYSIYAEARNGEHTVRNEVRGFSEQGRKYSITNTVSTIASKKKIQKILPILAISKVYVFSSRIWSSARRRWRSLRF